jgi:hypothetical protein
MKTISALEAPTLTGRACGEHAASASAPKVMTAHRFEQLKLLLAEDAGELEELAGHATLLGNHGA